MISKVQGRCKGCGKPTNEGEDIYWTKEAGGWHWHCWDNRKPGADAFRLADELGFVPSGDIERASWSRICADWVLRNLRKADRSNSAGRSESGSHPRQNATLF